MADPLVYIVGGLLVGIMVGLTGVGGGSLMTPLLILVFGQSPATAVGTDLAFAGITKVAATASFGYSRRIDWRVVGRLALGSIPGALAAIAWFWLSPSPLVVDHLILRALAVMLAITAAGLLLQHSLRHLGLRLAASIAGAERYQRVLTLLSGFLIGGAVALTSVGAGALGTVALVWLYPLRLPGDRLVATDIAHALPITVIAGLGHAALGHLNLPVLACLLIGSIPGILIASRLAIRLPQAITRALVATMLVVAAGRVFLTS
ncbi:MAG TPA: sulfite exporter TauE/SafE family protein [Steroidobacteraceae bacterium]|nr:sulfite exporter TauE/SafE family protein [Steroidobacteraceae bacterium]